MVRRLLRSVIVRLAQRMSDSSKSLLLLNPSSPLIQVRGGTGGPSGQKVPENNWTQLTCSAIKICLIFCGIAVILIIAGLIFFTTILKQKSIQELTTELGGGGNLYNFEKSPTNPQTSIDWLSLLRLFRGPFNFILFLYLISCNLHFLRESGIKFLLIFDLDGQQDLSKFLLKVCIFFTILWIFCFFLFINWPSWDTKLFNPLGIFYLSLIVFFICPAHIWRYEFRYWLFDSVTRIFISPLLSVRFIDFWLADQMNSLASVFLDFEHFIAFSLSQTEARNYEITGYRILWRALIAVLPAWFRFLQCIRQFKDTGKPFPYLVNAGKYSTTFLVVIFSTLSNAYAPKEGEVNIFLFLWLASAIISSIYSCIWDFKFDWGLFTKVGGEKRLLRERILYSRKFYYFAIVQNLFLRFGWTLSFTNLGWDHNEVLMSILSPLEIYRRFTWNFIRIEYEQLNIL